MMKSQIIVFMCCMSMHAQTAKTEFADILIESYYSNANSNFSSFYGGTPGRYPIPTNPEVILGENRSHFLSLPEKSYVIVQFTDNQIIDFPNQDDIFIKEIGCSGEKAEVYVSTNGKEFIKLGIVDDCRTSSLDLNSIGFKSVVRFVKVVGIGSQGASPGFDLVYIKGLPNSNVESYTDSSAIEAYFDNPEAHDGKKMILESVYFESNSATLNDASKKSLDALFTQLSKHPDIKIKIVGHTDNIGDNAFNLTLSAKRSKSVCDFLIVSGIDQKRILSEGKGETQPIKSNESEDGRQINRRVEFEIVR